MATALVALLLGLLLYRPRYALWMTLGCMTTALLGAWVLLRLDYWWSPAACLIGLLLSYLIWNWRRLSVILAYFGWELARLDNEPKVLLNVAVRPPVRVMYCKRGSLPWNKR